VSTPSGRSSATTIPQLVAEAATRFGPDDAVAADEARITFTELAALVRRSARALVASGIEPGDRVAVWAPNLVEWIVSALGVHSVGATLVPVNTRFKGAETEHVLQRTRARLLLTVGEFLGVDHLALLGDRSRFAALREVVLLRGEAPDTVGYDEFLARAEQVPDAVAAARAEAVGPDDLCHILFTSGTTGEPKGVMLAHGQVCAVYDALCDVFGFRAGDRQLVVLPFFHSFGLHVGVLGGLLRGMTIVPHLVFDTETVMARIAAEHITCFPGPPTVFQAICDDPRRAAHDLSSLRTITIGAASLPPSLVLDIATELGVHHVNTGYGLTEASGTVSLTTEGDPAEVVLETDGRPLPGVEVKIVDVQGVVQPVGSTGEVLVRGYNVMVGYLDDPQATAEAIDTDGWLHTGDIGHVRPDGNLVITDRLKDMYINGGFNVYPAEVEAVLSAHPDVAQVAVIGVADPRQGEVGKAFVVAATGATIDEAELTTWARERMANYKVPRQVRVVASLPLNATGKVLKGELRALTGP
jgi:acyl-CoA synthetase (AMP-forming)/AMP-acid ligase II